MARYISQTPPDSTWIFTTVWQGTYHTNKTRHYLDLHISVARYISQTRPDITWIFTTVWQGTYHTNKTRHYLDLHNSVARYISHKQDQTLSGSSQQCSKVHITQTRPDITWIFTSEWQGTYHTNKTRHYLDLHSSVARYISHKQDQTLPGSSHQCSKVHITQTRPDITWIFTGLLYAVVDGEVIYVDCVGFQGFIPFYEDLSTLSSLTD